MKIFQNLLNSKTRYVDLDYSFSQTLEKINNLVFKSIGRKIDLYDKNDLNGTELRTIAGSFLFSIGANEFAGRYTEGHFDLPVMGCTIKLDNETVVEKGQII